jgi:hypothetical protein
MIMRYEVRSTDDHGVHTGYGVWDTYLVRWMDNAFGQDVFEDEGDAGVLAADLNASCETTVAAGRCTLCENDAAELVPWTTRERLCWECVDQQMDLLARAVEDILPVEVKHLDVAVTRELVHA